MNVIRNRNIFLIVFFLLLVTVYSSKAYAASGDGTNSEGVSGFVDRLYSVCLDRHPDDEGKKFWTDKLSLQEQTGVEVAYGFVFSEEFKNRNLCNEDFVEYLYKSLMGREFDEEGKKNWISALESGKTRENVFNGFALSSEFSQLCDDYGIIRGDKIAESGMGTVPNGACSICEQKSGVTEFVDRLYKVCLDRQADEDGLKYWCKKLLSHEQGGYEIASGFVFSEEFQNRNLSNEEFVEYMYKAFFDRDSDVDGKAYWGESLDRGDSREYVFYGFAASSEFENLCRRYGIRITVQDTIYKPKRGSSKGWVEDWEGQIEYGCHKVQDGYYFTRDSWSVNSANDFVMPTGSIYCYVEYTVLENQEFNDKNYKLGDHSKFSYEIEGITEKYEFSYLGDSDVRVALTNGKTLPTYIDTENKYYKYSLIAVPNYQNSISDIEESLYMWAASGVDNYKGPYNAMYKLCFPSGCVDGSFRINVFYDDMLIDSFMVNSNLGTHYATIYNRVNDLPSSMSIRDKLLELYKQIMVNYHTNCIGGADLFGNAARHVFGLEVAHVMNKPYFDDDENVDEPCVVNNGTSLGEVKYFVSGYCNTKMLKNISYIGSHSFSGNVGLVYTHMSTLVYYEDSWWYWDAQGFAN